MGMTGAELFRLPGRGAAATGKPRSAGKCGQICGGLVPNARPRRVLWMPHPSTWYFIIILSLRVPPMAAGRPARPPASGGTRS